MNLNKKVVTDLDTIVNHFDEFMRSFGFETVRNMGKKWDMTDNCVRTNINRGNVPNVVNVNGKNYIPQNTPRPTRRRRVL